MRIMMKKIACLVVLTTIISLSASARVRTELEWGYTATMWKNWHYNYIEDAGYRVDVRSSKGIFNSNGQLLLHLNNNFGEKLQLGVFSGYAGINQSRQIVPVGLEANWSLKGNGQNGPQCFARAGAALHHDCKATSMAAIGGAYHLQISQLFGLNLKLSLQIAGDHPDIPEISVENTRRSDVYYGGVNLTIGIDFL